MFRYFCFDENINNNRVTIEGGDAKHLKTILRAQEGDKLSVVTESKEYIAEIESINKEDILCTIVEETMTNNETKINITLCQGIPKQTKMEITIQQTIKLGVKRFIP